MKYIFNPISGKFDIVETDHTKLSNIGTNTHAQIDTALGTTIPNTYIPYTGGTTDVNLGAHNLTVDTNTFFADSVNNRIGIGIAAPTAKLHIVQGTLNEIITYKTGNVTLNETRSLEEVYNQGVLRYILRPEGQPAWYLSSGVAEVGRISYTTPAGNPAIYIIGVDSNDRCNLKLLGDKLSLGATTIGGNPGDHLVIDSSGRVGIGTISPLSKLTIGSATTVLTTSVGTDGEAISINGLGSAIAFGAENRTGTDGAFLSLYSNNGAAMANGVRLGGFLVGGASSASSLRNSILITGFSTETWVDGSAYGSRLAFETTANGGTSRTEKMTILGNGNIGIGTTAPKTKLSVGSVSTALGTNGMGGEGVSIAGTLAILLGAENTAASSSDAGAFSALYSNDGAAMASGDRLGGFLIGGSSSATDLRNSILISAFATENWVNNSAYGSRLSFETTANGGTSRTEKMTILGNGNIGIGTTSPLTKVHNAGNFACTPVAKTVAHTGVALTVLNTNVEVTTDGDSDEDNGTLADGVTVGQIINIYVVAVGNAADSFKITPTTMVGGTKVSFAVNPLGKGCTMVWSASGWICVSTNGGVVS